MNQTRRLRLGPQEQTDRRYYEVEVDLVDAESVEVTLSYDRSAAVIDLGCADSQRWRGWSGGARSRFVIAPEAATPGYEPGSLPDGRWAVVLGLHQVPAEGVEVEVTVNTPAWNPVEADAPVTPPSSSASAYRGSHRQLPAPHDLTWYAGDFHAHTTHSDGDQSIAQLAARAVECGLDFVAVTDHNTVSHHRHLPEVSAAFDLTLLPGQEVTTARGHANAFGDIGWIDFREPASTWVEEVERRGGILSINHPLDEDCAWQHTLPRVPAALELWHIGWFRDLTATGPWALWRLWPHDPALLGGSDFHNPSLGYPPGTPTTWVAAEDHSTEAILAAVAAGRTAITRFPTPDEPALVRVDDDLVAVAADGTVLVDIEGRRRLVRGERDIFRVGPAERTEGADAGPYRLETVDGSLLAICR